MGSLSIKAIPACFALLCIVLTGCHDPLSIREKCFRNGNKFYERGKYKEASILYRRALQLDARFADAWYHLGLTNEKLGQGAGALAAFQRAVELDPNNEDTNIRLADIYARAGLVAPDDTRRDLMISALDPLVKRLLKKNPHSYDGLRLAGYLALIEHDRKLAIARFRAANEAKPWEPEVMLRLADTLAVDGQTQEAAKLGEELLARHKDNLPMYSFLYDLYLRTSRPDLAEQTLKRRIQNMPEDGHGRIQLALIYYITGRHQEMLAVIQGLRDDRKKIPGVDGLIGDFDVIIGDWNAAVEAFRDGAKFNAKERAAYEEKAIDALALEGKKSEALAAADRLYKSAPRDPGVAAFRAMLRAQIDPRELQASIAAMESLAAQNPSQPLIHFYLGKLYVQKADSKGLAKARVQLQTALAERPDLMPAKTLLAQVNLMQLDGAGSVQAADDVLRRDPGNLSARISRALAYSMLHEPAKARQDLEVALTLHKSSIEARLGLAGIDLAQKHYQNAEKGFAMAAQAGDPRGYVGLAQVAAAQGNVNKAIGMLRTECARIPDSRDCVSALAALELQAGHLLEAKNAYVRMTQMEPQSAAAFGRLGDAQFKMGDAAGALASFRKARELDPTDVSSALGMAVILDASGKRAQAASAYEETLRLDSTNAQALNNLAYIKAEQGTDLDRALAMAQKAVQQSSENTSFQDTLGLVYYKRGLIESSIGVYQPLVKKYPDNSWFHLHLAMALYAAAKPDQAAKELRIAMREGPSAGEQHDIAELAAKLRASPAGAR